MSSDKHRDGMDNGTSSIDFDEAAAAWRANKRPLGRGLFAYRCCYVHSTGSLCGRTVEASQRAPTYATHPHWVPRKRGVAEDPSAFCVRHRVRGPIAARQYTETHPLSHPPPVYPPPA